MRDGEINFRERRKVAFKKNGKINSHQKWGNVARHRRILVEILEKFLVSQ